MIKAMIVGMGCVCLLATAAPAQEVTVGPGGVTIGRDHDREWQRRHMRNLGEDRTGTVVERQYGSRCHTVTIREEDDNGDTVTKRVRRCN
jgi:hypothetical protein